MTGRVFLAGLLGAVLLFVWGFVAWVALPLAGIDMHPLAAMPGAEPAINAIDELKLDEGVYHGMVMKPGAAPDDPNNMDQVDETKPAIAFLVWKPQGYDPKNMTTSFIAGFLIYFLQALLAAFLLNIVAPVIRKGYGGRVLFVTWLGVFASLTVHLMYLNWMMFPMGYTLGMCADTVIGWFLAGLILAAVVRPATAANQAATTAM